LDGHRVVEMGAVELISRSPTGNTFHRYLCPERATDQIFLVMDAGSPVAAFTARQELKAFLQRRLDAFINPLVYTFWDNQGKRPVFDAW
jgi:DNA polymerase III epsilon subunit-like protein